MLFLAFFALFFLLWGLFALTAPLGRWILNRVAHKSANLAPKKDLQSAGGSDDHPLRAYTPVIVILVVGAVLTTLAGDAFLDLAEDVRDNSPALQRIDHTVHDWAVSNRDATATTFFALASTVGGPFGMAAVLVIALALLLRARRYYWTAYLAVTAGGGALLNLELKHHFARARPAAAEMLRQAHGYSFPSGHAMGATIVLGALTYLAFRVAPTWNRKTAVLAFADTTIVAVASSRVYLGVHWLSDVAAGIVAGALWLTATTLGYETLRRIRMIRLRVKRARGVATTG